jgi:predicted DNA-binding transcriptional regulator
MVKHNKKHRLGIVDFSLVDAGLSHHEALIFSYVQRFERNKRPCFASIPHIAQELRFSESATKRHIRRLIATGYLRETSKGRGRYLNTNGVKKDRVNGVNLAPNGVKMNPYTGQNDPNDRGQNEPLPLKVLPLKDYQKKIPVAVEKESFVTKDGQYDWLRERTGISLDEIPE